MTKLVRVEMEDDDGMVTRLTGDEAERWRLAAGVCISLSTIHGTPMTAFKWEVVTPPDLAPALEDK